MHIDYLSIVKKLGLLAILAISSTAAYAQAGEKGYATGRIADGKGNPLAGVEVTVENTLIGNHTSAGAVTDNQGNYKIKLSNIGSFHASAYLKKSANGVNYLLPLHPNNNAPFGNEGAVRHFQWKLSGPKPGAMEGFYGATMEISNEPGYYIDEEKIEFTLTPVGALIDGSQGATLKLKPGMPQTPTYGMVVNIPLGKYSVSAVYKNGGATPLLLKKRDSDQAYGASTIVTFEQRLTGGTPLAGISYKAAQ